MIVVADTSPLNYLVLIGATEILPSLYGRVVVPAAVAQELKHAGSPEPVRAWMAPAPLWLEVRPDPITDPALARLDSGGRAALTLVQLLNGDRLLIDDRLGRREAMRRHIPVTGTLGVLADAHVAGLLDFDEAVTLLRTTNFRLDPDIERLARGRISEARERAL